MWGRAEGGQGESWFGLRILVWTQNLYLINFSHPFKLMLPLKFKKVEWIVGHVLSSGI